MKDFGSKLPVVVLLAALLVIGTWYAHPIIEAHQIGIKWRDTMSAYCVHRRTEWRCTTETTSTRGTAAHGGWSSIQFVPVTRRIIRLERHWSAPDSASWGATVDSIRRAISSSREKLPCDPAETGFAIAEAWRLGSDEVRLYAASIPADKYVPHEFYIAAVIARGGSRGCGRTTLRELMTPAQMAAALHEWLAEHLEY